MLRPFVLASLLTFSLATAATPEPGAEKTQALYFHPGVTLITAGIASLPLMLPLTYERELEDAKSLTLQPTVVLGSYKLSSSNAAKVDVTGAQLVATLRNYLNGHVSNGLYLAPGVRIGYASYIQEKQTINAGYYTITFPERKAKVFEIDALGFLGYRAKFENVSIYTDLGLGYGYKSLSGDDIDDMSGTGLALDINIGIGYNF